MTPPLLMGAAGAAAMLAAAFFVGDANGAKRLRLKHAEAALEAVAETDKSDRARIDDLAAALVMLAENDAQAEAARVKGMEDLKRAIRNNRPPADGCRLTADDIERLRPIYDAANAARAQRGGSRTESDESGAGAVRGRGAAGAYPPE